MLAGLSSLGLAHNEVKAEGARALCRSRHLARLRALDLDENKIGDEGAKVLAADVTDAVEETAHEIKAAGGTALAVKADAGSEPAVIALVERASKELGGLHVFYANAGISGGWTPLAETSVEHFQEILRVNLLGPFLAIKHASPLMTRQGSGSIVCTASVAGLRANAGGLPYSASKAGVHMLTKSLACEWATQGVRVNAIAPGGVETEGTHAAGVIGSDFEKSMISKTALGRLGQPDDIARIAVFLASDDSGWLTGERVVASGGYF